MKTVKLIDSKAYALYSGKETQIHSFATLLGCRLRAENAKCDGIFKMLLKDASIYNVLFNYETQHTDIGSFKQPYESGKVFDPYAVPEQIPSSVALKWSTFVFPPFWPDLEIKPVIVGQWKKGTKVISEYQLPFVYPSRLANCELILDSTLVLEQGKKKTEHVTREFTVYDVLKGLATWMCQYGDWETTLAKLEQLRIDLAID